MTKSSYWKTDPERHTVIKSEIIVKYFMVWSSIIRRNSNHLTYLDLFAGRGEHDTGALSTAMRVIDEARKDDFLCENLHLILNDKIRSHTDNINDVLKKHSFRKTFKHKIEVANVEVNDFTPEQLNRIKLGSTFCFIDPHGFKGLSKELVRAVIKDFGCDSVIFFHTSGINRNFQQGTCSEYLRQLFGQSHYNMVLGKIRDPIINRENLILSEFKSVCEEIGVKYFLPFKIYFEGKNRLSHHLIFLSKHWRGFSIMKDVMSEFSVKRDSIPIFATNCLDETEQFELNIGGPMDQLKEFLLRVFAGRKLMVKDLIEECHREGSMCTTKNIKSALDMLERSCKIKEISPSKRKRKKSTFGDKRIVYFPRI